MWGTLGSNPEVKSLYLFNLIYIIWQDFFVLPFFSLWPKEGKLKSWNLMRRYTCMGPNRFSQKINIL